MEYKELTKEVDEKNHSLRLQTSDFRLHFALQSLQLTVLQFLKTIFLRYSWQLTVSINEFFALQSLQLIVLQKKYLLLVDYQWMRNRNTIEFLGIWEQLFNPSFNPLEFEGVRMSQGQVNDIKNNTLADVTVTGHWHHDFQSLQLTVLQLLKRKNRFRILETRGQGLFLGQR